MTNQRCLASDPVYFAWRLVVASALTLALVQPAAATPTYSIVQLGFDDLEHTSDNGYKSSYALDLNEAGQVLGGSPRYNGSNSSKGQSVWLYDGATTIDIGLTGAEHTSIDGSRFSQAFRLNEAGQVSGYAQRFSGGSTELGQSAWLYDGATTIIVGLTGAEYTRDDGFRFSEDYGLNEAGQVIGYVYRYNGSSDLGQSAWLYDGETTFDIGLTGAEHTSANGYRFSYVNDLNDAGQVIGGSQRYSGSNDLGMTAWLYDGATTIDIGLTGAEHTRNDGYRYSIANGVNDAGQVLGNSYRYDSGSNDLGLTAWLYDGETTIDIGLKGVEYTRDDGYRFSEAYGLNEAGQVFGNSIRYNGGSIDLGQDAWLYDPVLDQTFPLQLSTDGDGNAYSGVNFLGEDGLTLGSYNLFDTMGNDLGPRAFYFTIADGLHDLGALVDGGLTANGWDWLANVLHANSRGQILGQGKLTSQSVGEMAYLLTPEPIVGDYNGDGVVDAADYVWWRKNDGTQEGYDVWRAHFGDTVGDASLSDSTVPEPTTLILLSLAATGLYLWGGRTWRSCWELVATPH